MANPLPRVPFTAKPLEANGYFSQPWSKFLREVFEKLGGSVALSLPDIEAQADELQTQVDSLTAQVSAISGGISADFNQGPVL